MREIKFRGKRVDNGEWIYGTTYYFDGRNHWIANIDKSKNGGNTAVSCLEWHIIKSIELGQYTGLKDKNGKEIYEGDIIICDFDRLNGEIEWDSFMYWKTELCLTADTIEIIGNKYENPELLEV